jgi:hypothetical protein
MGQRCPLFPGLGPGSGIHVPPTAAARGEEAAQQGAAVRAMLRGLAGFLCNDFLKRWIYEKCQLERPNGGGGPSVKQATGLNSQLFLLLDEMHQRQEHLARILEVGFTRHAPPERLLFGGCYLAATGAAEVAGNQAFVAGVFDRLREGESFVYWTDEVKQEEARLERWIGRAWAMLFLVVASLAALAAAGLYFAVGR